MITCAWTAEQLPFGVDPTAEIPAAAVLRVLADLD